MIFNDMVVENRLFLNKMRTKKYNILYEKENDFKLTYNIVYCALLFEFYRSAVSNHFRGRTHIRGAHNLNQRHTTAVVIHKR